MAEKKVFRTITHLETGLSVTPLSVGTWDAKNHKGGGRILLLESALNTSVYSGLVMFKLESFNGMKYVRFLRIRMFLTHRAPFIAKNAVGVASAFYL
jgi:hypothetical protein